MDQEDTRCVFRNSTWQSVKPGQNVKVKMKTNKSSKAVHPYVCVIKTKYQFFDTSLIVGHIPRQMSCQYHFFMKKVELYRDT